MTHPTDADVEAMARALDRRSWHAYDLARIGHPHLEAVERPDTSNAYRALSAIPHYIRAVETLERLRSASKHGESRGRSSGSDPVRVAEEASLPDADLIRAVEEREGLIAALEALVADVLEYERINNLAPNPGRRDCWQSVTNARAILSRAQAP